MPSLLGYTSAFNSRRHAPSPPSLMEMTPGTKFSLRHDQWFGMADSHRFQRAGGRAIGTHGRASAAFQVEFPKGLIAVDCLGCSALPS